MPFEEAIILLRRAGIEPDVVETFPPGRAVPAGGLRVLAVRKTGKRPVLIVSPSWPLPDV